MCTMPPLHLAAVLTVLLMLCSSTEGQTIGTACTTGGGQCGTDKHLECFTGLSICVCSTGYANDGTNNCAYDCGALASPTNGAVSTVLGTTAGDTAVYSCSAGYQLTGSTTRTCVDGTGWSDSAPTCVRGKVGDACDVDANLCNLIAFGFCNGVTCTCNAGYSAATGATSCTEVNECLSNPCQNGATCTNNINSFTCTCADGYTGTTCATNINECSSNPCTNGGTCVDGVNSFTCTCVAGYTGTLCATNINECASSPCQNFGTCTDNINSFTCACVNGFTGATCGTNINDCSPTPCQNGGTCTDGVASYTCACVAGYTDTDCSTNINECSSTPCQNGGTCTDNVNSYTCGCVAGFTGANCQTNINECSSNPCLNGGTCTDGVNSYTCSCVAGYTGTTCSTNIDECASSPCQNSGTCFDNINYFTCGCVAGYTGATCQTNINECASSPCQSGGTCLDAVNSYTCSCVAGYTGTNCQTDVNECASNPCLNSGVCTNDVNLFTCTCGPGYTDTTCRPSALGDNCASRSNVCFGLSNAACSGGLCSCNSGYENLGSGTCTPIDCGAVQGPTSGSVDLSGGTIYNSIAMFACNSGYTLSGATSRTCQADKTWSGTTPTCVINSCSNLTAPSNGAVSTPGGKTYLSQATYSCNTGYTISGDLVRTCQADSLWSGTAPTCIINDCGPLTAPTNGAVTYSANTNYLSVATFTCNPGYTLTGNTTRICQAIGLWDSASPTCVIKECPALTAPTDGAFTLSNQRKYLSVATFTCNTGYTRSGISTTTCQADATWDAVVPTCVINDCGTLTGPANGAIDLSGGTTYLSVVSFSCNNGYTLVGSLTRTCQASFIWNNDSPICVIKDCGTVTAPLQGVVNLTGGTTYQSVISYSCNAGYTLSGAATRTCQQTGVWGGTAPTCEINNCGTLLAPTDGTVNLSGGTTYQSTAIFACNTGYTLTGVSSRTCQANSTWSDMSPTCVIKDCGPPSPPSDGTVATDDGTTYTKTALYSCNTGYTLIGSATRTCGGTGTWDGTKPTCQIKDCGVLANPTSGSVSTMAGTTYGATANYACNTGYQLAGVSTRVCQPTGVWSDTAPTCNIKSCPALTEPTNGGFSLSNGNYYQSVATFTCNLGYTRSGTLTRTCTAEETWNSTSPQCNINNCGTVPAPTNGNVDLTGGTTYQSSITFSCNTGYTLSHSLSLTCQANSTWDKASPTCVINDCGTAIPVTNGAVSTTQGTKYLNAAVYTCSTGYTLVGTDVRYCTAAGTWETPTPTCQIKDCGVLSAPSDGTVSMAGTTYQEVATYSCDSGFNLSGFTTRTCTGAGTWSNSPPVCVRKDCGSLSSPSNGGVTFSNGTVFQSLATFTCNTGYILSGANTRTCLNTGLWEGTSPICIIKNCGTPSAPMYGSILIPTNTTYGDVILYSCNTGYQLNGNGSRTCTSSGTWSGIAPTCSIQDCGPLAAPVNGNVTYKDGTTTYGSTVIYACGTGYQVNGAQTRICQPSGSWSDSPPTCILRDCSNPFTVANGIYISLQGTAFGAVVTYQCNVGFGMVGEATVSCESDGTWSGLPTCIRDCGSPVTIANGAVTIPTGSLVGAKAYYTCSGGYLMSGNPNITCGTDGNWPTEPFCSLITTDFNYTCSTNLQCGTVSAVCRNDGNGANRCLCELTGYFYDMVIDECLKDCGGLPAPTHGDILLPLTTSEGQIVTYTCNTGYAISGTAIRTCLSTGQWSGTAPVCVTGCPDPIPPTNGYVNATKFTAGSIATYSCMDGFSLVGSRERICLVDSQWNGNQPYCYIECPTLPDVKNGHVDLSSGDWQESVATYICNNDYALVGTPTRTCQASGIWSGTAPECIFAVFPDILLAFGSLFVFLVLVDIVIIAVVVYFKYCKKKPEADKDFNKIDDMEDQELNNTLNPVFVTSNHDMMRNSIRKSRHAKITPEDIQHSRNIRHPPPKKIPSERKPEKASYFFRDNKHASLPSKPLGTILRANGPEHPRFKAATALTQASTQNQANLRKETKEVATHEYKSDKTVQDNYQNSESSSHQGAASQPEDDQFSIELDQNFGKDTERGDISNPEQGFRFKKADDPVHILKGRLHPPVVSETISPAQDGEKPFSEERRKLMKKTVSTYSPQY